MITQREYLIALATIEEMTSNKVNSLLKTYIEPSKIFGAIISGEVATSEQTKKMIQNNYVQKVLKRLEQKKISVVTIYDDMGERLKDVFMQCGLLWLFYIGDLNIVEQKSIAIVGSRKPDEYGKKICTDFTSVLATAGVVIVSGLATGIDSVAHKVCIENNSKTIAVLGGGFDNIYPVFNKGLAEQIVDAGGLLITEYAPHIKCEAYHFPLRNRIMAAIADGVFVAQMGEKSGALHTKNYAIDFGKNIYIAVADSYRTASQGNLNLIEEMPQCVVTNPARILLELGLEFEKKEQQMRILNEQEQTVVDNIKDGEKHFDELVELTKIVPATLLSLLTGLKIDGIVVQLAGNYWCL